MGELKHPQYGNSVPLNGPVPILKVVPEEAIPFLMLDWKQTVQANGIDFTKYVVQFNVTEREEFGRNVAIVSYTATHIEDVEGSLGK